MKVGDLVRIVWTVGKTAPAVVGLVTGFDNPALGDPSERQKVQLLSNGKLSWFEHGDLEVLAA